MAQSSSPTIARPDREREAIDAARGGSDDAFRLLVEQHRTDLHAHCYRMLGSLQDAEDALQDALLRAWRGLPGFAGRSSLRTWLYRIATNACLDVVARRSRRVLPIDYGPASDPLHGPGEPLLETVWIEPYPDQVLGIADGYAAPDARYEQREAVELAFVAALQHLPAKQRAALIMRDVLGFSAREVAESLETTVASANSALQRARRAVAERLPERSQQATSRALGDERMRELLEAYLEAWARADVEALRGLLAEDAIVSMPPWTRWWRGREAIVGFAPTAATVCGPSRTIATHANGQPGVAFYSLDAATGRYAASAIGIFTFDGAAIKEITTFAFPEVFAQFGLPPVFPSP
jgi:RNA polymerase sigma-70 factor (ECF subfamily)